MRVARKQKEKREEPCEFLPPLNEREAKRGTRYYFFFLAAAFFAGFLAAAAFFAGFLAASFFAGFLVAIDDPPFPSAVARRKKF
jgi:hypothetical protein